MLLRTLGGLQLEGADFKRPKALLLLCYLSLEGPQERHHLAELFWPGAVRGRTDLSTTLSRLRKHAPGSVEADAAKVWTAVSCDVDELFNAAEKGKLAKVVELYQGRFLNGFDTRALGSELEEWVYGTREFLASQVQSVQLKLAEEAAVTGQFKAAAKRAETAYRITNSTPEPLTLARLHTLMLAGGSLRTKRLRKEAEDFELPLVRSQQEAQERLREVLGGEESTIPNNLSFRSTSFVGREIELAEVTRLLSEHRLVTLLGPGGVGKSRLALQAAQQQLREGSFPNGVFFVPMDALSSADAFPASIANAISLVLDRENPVGPLQQITRRLGRERVLLLMDNFEHLVGAASFASELLQGCPNLKILVTSRERLHLEEEWLFEVGGLVSPTDASLTFEQSKQFDAVQLFMQRARQANPEFVLGESNLPQVVEIATLVEGLPLALELSAVWVRAMPVSELAAELKRNLDVLATPRRDVQDRHKTIQASFEHSWKLLSTNERVVLRNLSVFRGGFRREAASKVAGATLPMLAGLVDKSLLRLSSSGRYDRHPLLYQFSQQKLAEHPKEKALAEGKHGEYYFSRLCGFDSLTDFGAAIFYITEELENIRAAWDWATEHERAGLLERGAFNLGGYFLHTSRFQEGLGVFSRTVESLKRERSIHPTTLGACLCMWAWLGAWSWMDPGEALEMAEQGHALMEPPNSENIAAVMMGREAIFMSYTKTGRLSEAKAYAADTLALAERVQIPFWKADGWAMLGISEASLGNLQEAKRCLETAIAMSKRIGAEWYQIVITGFLAQIYLSLGEIDEAKQLSEEGLIIARALQHQRMQVILSINLGDIALKRGVYPEARVYYEQALKVAQQRDVQPFLAQLSWGLGRAHLALGQDEKARAYLQQHLEVSRQNQDHAMMLSNLSLHAEIQAHLGQPEQACQWLILVTQHPATSESVNTGAGRLLNKLHSQVPEEAFEEANALGQTLKLETVVEEILG